MSKTILKNGKLQLSVSSVDTFRSCKAKWYYRYVAQLPSPPTYHLTTGSFIHKILEIFLRRYKKSKNLRDAGTVAYRLALKDKDLIPYLTDYIKQEGKDWLKQIVKKYETSPELIPNVEKIESPFTFTIGDKILVRGFIDRIDNLDKDTLNIIDYKTNSKPDYLKSFQLATYSIATQKKYPNKKIKTAYELIRFDFERKEFEITDQDRLHVINTFKEVAFEINSLLENSPDQVWQATPTKLCDYCPYKNKCEQDRQKSPWEV